MLIYYVMLQRHASGQNSRSAWELQNLKSLRAEDRICMLNIKTFNQKDKVKMKDKPFWGVLHN